MTVDRTTTYGLHQTTLSGMNKVSGILGNLQIQISSGFKSQNFAGVSDKTFQFLQLEDKINSSNYFISNNSIIESRMQTTDNIIGQLIDTATQLKSLIVQRRAEPLDVGVFETQLDGIWKSVSSQLNTQMDGRYLFGGSKTDAPPVDLNTFPTLDGDGNPTQSYYQGDSQDLVANIDANIQITYNVRANEEGINKLFGAIAAASEGDELDSDEKFVAALNFLDEAIDGMVTTQARLNSNIIQIGEIKSSLQTVQTYWKGLKEEIVNTDLVDASTQVAINQGILQASFQAFARINSLSLSDFI